ncbi:MAG: hypothetical protein R3F48_05250 [Candidatus Zixiibacteriota bacterium]
MSEEKKKILQLLADGKIDVEQAERLLSAVGEKPESACSTDEKEPILNRLKPKCLCIEVNPKEGHESKEKVNIKIPVMLIKAGIKLGSVLPGESKDKVSESLRKKGINLDLGNLDSDTIDDLLKALTCTCIDVDDEKESVKIYCQ